MNDPLTRLRIMAKDDKKGEPGVTDEIIGLFLEELETLVSPDVIKVQTDVSLRHIYVRWADDRINASDEVRRGRLIASIKFSVAGCISFAPAPEEEPSNVVSLR